MTNKKFWISAVGGLIIGALFMFPTKQFLTDNNLLLGLTYNDHILVGTLAFIIAIAAIYRLLFVKSNHEITKFNENNEH